MEDNKETAGDAMKAVSTLGGPDIQKPKISDFRWGKRRILSTGYSSDSKSIIAMPQYNALTLFLPAKTFWGEVGEK